MAIQERHIRRLNLSAPSETLARRGAILVEDAFRTASLPASGGRLLIIRSLSLGSIGSSRSPAAVALAIEERLRLLGSTAVYAGDASASCQSVVYFHNEAEPYIQLEIRLASGQSTEAWFWPLAVRGFSHGMSRDVALRAVLLESVKTGASAAVGVEIVRSLIENGVADRLFEALQWQDGPRLLRQIGLSMPDGFVTRDPGSDETGRLSEVPVCSPEVAARWHEVAARWIGKWGAGDARSFWLAAVALIERQRARSLEPATLSARARQLIKRVIAAGNPLNAYRRDEPGQARQTNRGKASDDPGLAGVCDMPIPSEVLTSLGLPVVVKANSVESGGPDIIDSESGGLRTGLPNMEQRTEVASASPPVLPFTRHAGIFFLLPIMSRLGITSLLKENPHLIDCDLPVRLLLTVGHRLGIRGEDPIAQMLTAARSQESTPSGRFVQPSIWKQGICNDGPLIVRRVEGKPRERVLFDGSGRLALALWQAGVPDLRRQLANERSIRRGAPFKLENGLDPLLESWLLAIRRWSRRYAGIGLRDLVCRPGRVSLTNTHVDAVFDHRLADIRVRKAGLDLDAGWIPWFGRVVTFHYQYGELLDG